MALTYKKILDRMIKTEIQSLTLNFWDNKNLKKKQFSIHMKSTLRNDKESVPNIPMNPVQNNTDLMQTLHFQNLGKLWNT